MTLTAEYLMKQAGMTAAEYMLHAEESIDKQFGKGFAQKNPALVGAFMQTAAADFNATFMAQKVETLTDALQSVASKFSGD